MTILTARSGDLEIAYERLGDPAAYSLSDMGGDAVAVLDAMGWPAAHLVGASVGGMIAQTLAIEHPGRVLSLTSIMSTPASRIGRMRVRALLALIRRARRLTRASGRPTTPEAMADFTLAMQEITGSPAYPADREDLLAMLRVSLPRDDEGFTGAGTKRQNAAAARHPTAGRPCAVCRSPPWCCTATPT